jgi:hypothetical protein
MPPSLLFSSASSRLVPADTWCDAHTSGGDPLWLPHSEITFGFLDSRASIPDSAPTEYRKQRVRDALSLYMQHSALKFKEVNIRGLNFSQADARQSCQVRIALGKSAQSRSDGTLVWGWVCEGSEARFPPQNTQPPYATVWIGGQATLRDEELPPEALNWSNVVLHHELGHVAGFQHEHAELTDPTPNSSDT